MNGVRKVNGFYITANKILTAYGERRRFRFVDIISSLLPLLGFLGPGGRGGRRRRPFAAHVALLHLPQPLTSFALADDRAAAKGGVP